ELTATDALRAHLETKLGIDADEIVSPWHAAFASAVSFLTGSILPMLSILLLPEAIRVPFTFVSVLFALALTGWVGAWIGGGSKTRASTRVVFGGAVALAATFAIGSFLGHL
ncbi:MAG: VIT1/CCC1 transporter family protein, partial [Leifsonia sp.]